MSFSDTCIETITELCANVVRYGKDGSLGAIAPQAILAIRSLADVADTLDLGLFPAEVLHLRNPDGYFLGNLLNAVVDDGDQQSVDFLADMARAVAELGQALERYELACRDKPSFVDFIDQQGQTETLQKVLHSYHHGKQGQTPSS